MEFDDTSQGSSHRKVSEASLFLTAALSESIVMVVELLLGRQFCSNTSFLWLHMELGSATGKADYLVFVVYR